MLVISSRDNPKIKSAKRVRDGAIDDLIFIEGARLAEEALRSHLKIADVFFTETFRRSERGAQLLRAVETSKCSEVSDKVFDSLADTKNSQGVILIAEKPQTNQQTIESGLLKSLKTSLLVLLHQINNPSNLGAILRTCEAVNVNGVILTKNSADAFSPKALRGAMGASLRLPIWENADFYEVLDWAKKNDFVSVCADVNATKSYLEIDWQKPRLIVFGSEAQGLSREEYEKVDENLLIPMENEVESLNLAVSAGVILFEARRNLR